MEGKGYGNGGNVIIEKEGNYISFSISSLSFNCMDESGNEIMENESKKPLLVLFDGNALVHRAYHAIPPLTVSKTGELVNAVYGFASTLLKVLAELQPDYWAVAFDYPAPTFRHKMFEGYKAQRKKTPEELIKQIIRVHHLVEVFNIPVFEVDGYEADDTLGTLSRKATEGGVESVIVTGDNDMLQLLSEDVKAFMPRRSFNDSFLYDVEAVQIKYGVSPGQIVDYKALVGDASDNVTGVPGIGSKTAAKLIQGYGSLEEIYAHISEIAPNRVQTMLSQNKSQAFQSKELVTIIREVPIELNLEVCRVNNFDREKVVELFQELEFSKLLPRLPRMAEARTSTGKVGDTPKASCTIVDSEAVLGRLIDELKGVAEIVILGLFSRIAGRKRNTTVTSPTGIVMSPSRGSSFYLPLEQYELNRSAQIPLTELVQLRPILEDASVAKVTYESKRELTALANCGISLQPLHFDLKLAAYLLGEKNLTLAALAFNKLGMEIISLDELPGTRNRRTSAEKLSTEQIADRSCANLEAMWRLQDILKQELYQQGLWSLFSELEMPLVPVIAAMERDGIALDTRLLKAMSLELNGEILKLELEIYNSVGHKFNINSPRQLGKVLFEELKLPQVRKKKNGPSTEAAVLEELLGTHPVIEFVLKYRQFSKLKTTYVDALPALVDQATGRVHTIFNQTGTTTGRLSSSDPNLQNIPVRSTLGSQIRKAFISPRGSFLLSADYSQIDLRALAHLSQDMALITSFKRNEDIHSITASTIFSVPIDEVTSEMRNKAKAVNFGVIYGMSDYGLVQATGISREEAAAFISLYFERYSGVKEYLETTKEQARKSGFVQTIMGRRRFIPEINSANRMIRAAAERMAINAPVQGTSADIIKVAMLNIYREMKKRELKSKMLLQIHDELLFEVPEGEIEEMKSMTKQLMADAIKLSVPLEITIKLGRNWGDLT